MNLLLLTQDITAGSSDKGTWRMSGTLLWSYSPGTYFNLRLGAKSFLWGNLLLFLLICWFTIRKSGWV
ncbi:MAG: hypothetical protein IPJ32_08235 [Sphingobacteriaceae bacterium]|nr:hypothetical protein [Sphingobacteriaceae bacterium]